MQVRGSPKINAYFHSDVLALNSSIQITSVKGLRLTLIELENNVIEVVDEIPNFLDKDLNDCFSLDSFNILILRGNDILECFCTMLEEKVKVLLQSLHINHFCLNLIMTGKLKHK